MFAACSCVCLFFLFSNHGGPPHPLHRLLKHFLLGSGFTVSLVTVAILLFLLTGQQFTIFKCLYPSGTANVISTSSQTLMLGKQDTVHHSSDAATCQFELTSASWLIRHPNACPSAKIFDF
ncbi:hypothetical protein Tcan_12269 [Toxocara canis]|uniref:Uncharacterized protein n=1 Tax=Toxocara canis TaxID=6265 RepID=A0A0B2VR33_TOXCA|nr:hypothetical protein Tcan_12269 [Toxocara canis]